MQRRMLNRLKCRTWRQVDRGIPSQIMTSYRFQKLSTCPPTFPSQSSVPAFKPLARRPSRPLTCWPPLALARRPLHPSLADSDPQAPCPPTLRVAVPTTLPTVTFCRISRCVFISWLRRHARRRLETIAEEERRRWLRRGRSPTLGTGDRILGRRAILHSRITRCVTSHLPSLPLAHLARSSRTSEHFTIWAIALRGVYHRGQTV